MLDLEAFDPKLLDKPRGAEKMGSWQTHFYRGQRKMDVASVLVCVPISVLGFGRNHDRLRANRLRSCFQVLFRWTERQLSRKHAFGLQAACLRCPQLFWLTSWARFPSGALLPFFRGGFPH